MVQVNKSSHRVRFQLTSIVSRSYFSIMVTCYQTCKLTEQKRSSPLGHIGRETSRLPRIRKGVSHQLFAFTMGRRSHKELPKRELLPWHTNIHRRVLMRTLSLGPLTFISARVEFLDLHWNHGTGTTLSREVQTSSSYTISFLFFFYIDLF